MIQSKIKNQRICVWGLFDYVEDKQQKNGLREIYLPLPILSVACGAQHILFNTFDNNLYAIGSNQYGQLGISKSIKQIKQKPIKVELSSFSAINKIECGLYHSLLLDIEGNLYACGQGEYGAIGNNSNKNCYQFEPILRGISKISAGARHTLAINLYQRLYGWGDSQQGQLGIRQKNEYRFFNPRSLDVMQTKEISAKGNISLFLTQKGLYGCGGNNLGNLGIGHKDIVYTPTKINIEENIEKIMAGNYSIVMNYQKETFFFGTGAFGQFLFPVKIELPAPVNQICLGQNFGFVKSDNKNIYAWGSNRFGQLGFNHNINKTTPTLNNQLQKFERLYCGKNYVVGISQINFFSSVLELGQESIQSKKTRQQQSEKQNNELKKLNKSLKQKIIVLQRQNKRLKKQSQNDQNVKNNNKYNENNLLWENYVKLQKEYKKIKDESYSHIRIKENFEKELANRQQKISKLEEENKLMKSIINDLRISLQKSEGIGYLLEYRQMQSIVQLYQQQNTILKKFTDKISATLLKLKKEYHMLVDSIQSNEFLKLFFNRDNQELNFNDYLLKNDGKHKSQYIVELFNGISNHTNNLKDIIEQLDYEIKHNSLKA